MSASGRRRKGFVDNYIFLWAVDNGPHKPILYIREQNKKLFLRLIFFFFLPNVLENALKNNKIYFNMRFFFYYNA